MAADPRHALSRALTQIACAATAYTIVLLSGFYFHFFTVRRHHIESASFMLIAFLLVSVLSRRVSAEPAPLLESYTLSNGAITSFAIVGALLLYFPVIDAGLFADDFVLLDAARQGRLTVWGELFRPAIFVLWRAVAAVTDSPASWLHLLNIVLHGLNGAMVGALTSRLGLPHWSIAAAVLFLVFPGAVEAVAWPAGLQDVLMTTFLLAFLILTLSEQPDRRRWLTAAALLVAALATKETAVCAPVLALCLILPNRRWRSTWSGLALAAGVVASFLAVRMLLLPFPQTYRSIPDRYATKELLVRPFQSLLVPMRDVEVQALPIIALALAGLFVIALCAAAAKWSRWSVPFHMSLAATGVILASVAPVYSYFFVTGDLQGSRYLYLASAGWVLLTVTVLDASTRRHRAAVRATAAFMMICWIVATRAHIGLWDDAGDTRDRIIRAADAQMKAAQCAEWAVHGIPAEIQGVPTFVNGFPEAMRAHTTARIRVAPGTADAGECRMIWTGTAFAR